MTRQTIFALGLLVYSGLVASVALWLNLSVLVSSVLLLGAPAMLLAHYSAASTTVLVVMSVFVTCLAIFFEVLGYVFGLWVVTAGGVEGWLGLLLVTWLKVIFLVLFYELIFDDGQYQELRMQQQITRLFGAACFVILLAVGSLTLEPFTTSTGSFYGFVVAILAGSIGALSISNNLTTRLSNKLVAFTLTAVVPLLLLELILLANSVKEFGVISFGIPVFGITLPLSEIFLAVALPVLVVTVYELVIDDKK